MKTTSCDFCENKIERFSTLREGWTTFRCSYRWSGNTGGELLRLDICKTCSEKLPDDKYFSAKKNVVEFLSSVFKENK